MTLHLPALDALAARYPVQRVVTSAGTVAYRRAGAGPAQVLLHGIGSASGSWLRQFEALSDRFTLLAWDAPGYGATTPVPAAQPGTADYGARVWDWLDALDLDGQPVTLVGHSLGALMAAAAAGQRPDAVRRLVLLSPARGYAQAEPAERAKKLSDRLSNLQAFGPAGLAERRSAAMLSPAAGAADREWVRRLMAAIEPAGYTQAAHLLAGGDLNALLAALPPGGPPVTVASGAADTITPPTACESVARAAGCPYIPLGPVGHVCALEAAEAVNQLLADTLSGESA